MTLKIMKLSNSNETRVIADLKRADKLLAKYLGPKHPVRAELYRLIEARSDKQRNSSTT